MVDKSPVSAKAPSRGILTLVFIWVFCVLGAIGCYKFLPPAGTSESSATYGLNRAIPILALAAIASIDSLIAVVKTFRRRRSLSAAVKSLGYSPFFFTTGTLGTIVHRILTE